MSRIERIFERTRAQGRAAFIAYITAGDPSPSLTAELVLALGSAGADIIEIGIPFSDPIADGPVNQAAAERALAAGTKIDDVFSAVFEVRKTSSIPIVLFSYANPILRRGVSRFSEEAAEAGVDGVLFTDVPVEEIDRFRPELLERGIDPILLVTPTSDKKRIRSASRAGRGFLYLVSRRGVTGIRQDLDRGLDELITRVRKTTKLPVAVGFGISTPGQVARVAEHADGVIVGSAIVRIIAENAGDPELPAIVESRVRPLADACRS